MDASPGGRLIGWDVPGLALIDSCLLRFYANVLRSSDCVFTDLLLQVVEKEHLRQTKTSTVTPTRWNQRNGVGVSGSVDVSGGTGTQKFQECHG